MEIDHPCQGFRYLDLTGDHPVRYGTIYPVTAVHVYGRTEFVVEIHSACDMFEDEYIRQYPYIARIHRKEAWSEAGRHGLYHFPAEAQTLLWGTG